MKSARPNPLKNNGMSAVRPPPALLAALDGVQKPQAPFWEQGPVQRAPMLTPQQQAASRLMGEAGTLIRFGQFPPAAGLLQQAASLWPTNPEILYQFGCVLMEVGHNDEAVKRFDVAIGLRPNWSDAWNNKSAALARMGDVDGAVAAAEQAVKIAPNVAAYANLCAAYSGMGRNDDAIAAGEQAVKLSNGENVMALINYGVSLRATWALSEAAGSQERAIQLTEKDPQKWPPNYMAYSNLGAIRNLQGRNHEALAVTQQAAELVPGNSTVRSNMIMFADLLPETTLLEAYCMRRTWAHLYEAPLKRRWRKHNNDLNPGRRLRVGYVGADFRQHSAAHIHGAVIRAHDPEKIAVYVYAGNRGEDNISALIREAPALVEWKCTSGIDDFSLAEMIYKDEIDILVDCASFTSGGRLPTFACKPAPIQATAWGYATGTGLDSMDVFLADEVYVPKELEYGFRETVIRMSSLLTFDPFIALPPPGEPPVKKNGYVTFGSLNRVEKISPQILRLWCEVMKQVPDSRMILKFGGLTGEVAEQITAGFEHWGISKDRVDCRGHTPRDEHLRVYNEIDFALDCWPHVGGITTLEALMMGVPCVTLLGDRPPSRVSASILTGIGMGDWVAETPDQYVKISTEQAAADLSELRAGLPARVQSASVGNPEMYTRELEQVYRELWTAYCTKVIGGESAA